MRKDGRPRVALTMSWSERTGTSIPRSQLNLQLTIWRFLIISKLQRRDNVWKASNIFQVPMESQISKAKSGARDPPSQMRIISRQSSYRVMIWSRKWPNRNRKRSMISTRRSSLQTSTSTWIHWRRRRWPSLTASWTSVKMMLTRLGCAHTSAESIRWLKGRFLLQTPLKHHQFRCWRRTNMCRLGTDLRGKYSTRPDQ